MEYEVVNCVSQNLLVTDYINQRKNGCAIKFVRHSSSGMGILRVLYIICEHTAQFGFMCHRLDGPAHIDIEDNRIGFFIKDESYCVTEEYCRAAGISDEDTFMWLLRFGDELPKTIEGFYGDDWESIPMDQL